MPRIEQGVHQQFFDERVELVFEPDQQHDLVKHWQVFPVHPNGTTQDYQYGGDGAVLVTKIATTHPDVFVTFHSDHDWRKHVVGGPWVLGVGIEPHLWHVPVRRLFSMTAHNRSRETIRATVYMQLAARTRVGW